MSGGNTPAVAAGYWRRWPTADIIITRQNPAKSGPRQIIRGAKCPHFWGIFAAFCTDQEVLQNTHIFDTGRGRYSEGTGGQWYLGRYFARSRTIGRAQADLTIKFVEVETVRWMGYLPGWPL